MLRIQGLSRHSCASSKPCDDAPDSAGPTTQRFSQTKCREHLAYDMLPDLLQILKDTQRTIHARLGQRVVQQQAKGLSAFDGQLHLIPPPQVDVEGFFRSNSVSIELRCSAFKVSVVTAVHPQSHATMLPTLQALQHNASVKQSAESTLHTTCFRICCKS